MIDTEKLIQDILFGIEATTGKDDYSIGMRNGMRWVLSMITNEEPKFEKIGENESNSNLGRNRMNTSEYLPEDILEFLRSYSFKDEEKIYTNGAELIPLFRVVQALEYYYYYKKTKTPITEAVPVEWMEVWLAEHDAWDFHTTFIDMINDWRNRETE